MFRTKIKRNEKKKGKFKSFFYKTVLVFIQAGFTNESHEPKEGVIVL